MVNDNIIGLCTRGWGREFVRSAMDRYRTAWLSTLGYVLESLGGGGRKVVYNVRVMLVTGVALCTNGGRGEFVRNVFAV